MVHFPPFGRLVRISKLSISLHLKVHGEEGEEKRTFGRMRVHATFDLACPPYLRSILQEGLHNPCVHVHLVLKGICRQESQHCENKAMLSYSASLKLMSALGAFSLTHMVMLSHIIFC